MDSYNDDNNTKVLKEFILRQSRQSQEDMKFHSRSKQEYNELIKKPIYY